MKKVFALILALCLIAGIMPLAVMAEAPTEVNVKFRNGTAPDFTLTVTADQTAYVVEDGNKEIIKYEGTDAPADKFIKFEYVATEPATLKVTFNNLNVDLTAAGGATYHGIEFMEGEYAVAMELVGENSIAHQKSACIKYNNDGGMTITGEGSLTLNLGTEDNPGSANGALWANGGDLLIKSNLNFNVISSASAKYHAIIASKGSVTLDGAKINSKTTGGQVIWLGVADTKKSRTTKDDSADRFIAIKNSEVISEAKLSSFQTTNPVVISNSTVIGTKLSTASGTDQKYSIFWPAPKLEGEYTALAGLAKKIENIKEYSEKKLTSYTYIKIVPGIIDIPTEPVETEPDVPVVEVPDETQPDETQPDATQPDETQPDATQPDETQPDATQPDGTQPDATTPSEPAETDPTDTTGEKSGSPLKVVLIVILSLVVLAGAGIGVLFYLKKKGLLKK